MKRSLYSSQQHQTYLKLQNPYKEIGGKKTKKERNKVKLASFFCQWNSQKIKGG